MKKTITKTIKVSDIAKDYSISSVVYSPFSYTYETNGSNYYRVRVDKAKADKVLKNDLDKNIKNIRIVYEVEEPILDDKEKEYLSNVIKPFRNRVLYITKCNFIDNEYIRIELKKEGFALPEFKEGTMYKDMECGKNYSLEELGL